MQNLRIRKNNCLTFFDPGANTHLIDGTLEESENFQKFSDNQADLGVIGGGVITAGSGNFQFNLGFGKEGVYHEMKLLQSEFYYRVWRVQSGRTWERLYVICHGLGKGICVT